MNQPESYALFEKMISGAQDELMDFTLNSELKVDTKSDHSLVTACDQAIDCRLSEIARGCGLDVISEEGQLDDEKNGVREILRRGNYITIDPIDGTSGYIEYVNEAIRQGGMQNFLKYDLGPKSDLCLLIGIVMKSQARYGACFNYVTHEKILVDGENPGQLIREPGNRVQKDQPYSPYVVYLDPRPFPAERDEITPQLIRMPNVLTIVQAGFGLKSLYTLLNPHESAITHHTSQNIGLWDVMPAAVACRAFGGELYDNTGEPFRCDQYLMFPGGGGTVIRGNKFRFVIGELKNNSKKER